MDQEIVLKKGSHETREDGMCAMEAVAYIAGEPHSDHPQCVCPVIAAYMRSWNDVLPDNLRQELIVPLLPRLIGTRSTPEIQDARAIMIADWCQRVVLPIWCDLVPSLSGHATALRSMPKVATVSKLLSPHRRVIVSAAGAECYAARDAAWSAAGAAAGAAAWGAALAAAGDAAGDAVRNAAWAAVWDAARDAAWDAAGVAVWDAVRNAAEAAAGTAALAAAGAAPGAAARAAALAAAGDAAGDAVRNAAWAAVWDAARDAAWAAARNAARAAAGAAALAAALAAARAMLLPIKLRIWHETPAMILSL